MLHAPNGDLVARVLTVAQALALGYTPGRIRTELRSGRWDELARGVYLTRGELPARSDWIRAGLSIAGDGAVLSGWDGARVHHLGADRAPTDNILILSSSGTHRLRGPVLIRPSRRPLRCVRRPIAGAGVVPVATAARAVADTALDYHALPQVRALVTSAVQQGKCTLDDLATEYRNGPRNGSYFLRRAIDDVVAGAASISEAELADAMRAAGLPPFELNVPILDAAGRHIATADVLWRALRAALEVDSREHHFLEPKWQRTMRRHNGLTRYGLALTHYPPVDLRDRPDEVMTEVEHWLRGRAVELGEPYPPIAVEPGSPLRLTSSPDPPSRLT